MFLAFASIDVSWDSRYLPAAAVAGTLGLRTIAALSAWARADAEYQPMLQALERLPAHAAIYTGVNYQGPFEPLVRMPWSHFESYAAIRNRLFAHGIWADPTQNWIVSGSGSRSMRPAGTTPRKPEQPEYSTSS